MLSWKQKQVTMMRPKKLPLRKCVGCAEMKPKKELIRIVKPGDGTITADLTGKQNGRGAYLCHSVECLARARKTRQLERSFSCAVPPEIYDQLEQQLKGDEQ